MTKPPAGLFASGYPAWLARLLGVGGPASGTSAWAQRSLQLDFAQEPQALREALLTITEPWDKGFTLYHRISGAGVVVRSLRSPATERPFFGEIQEERLRFALVPRQDAITPFAAIARGTIVANLGGALLDLRLSPHPDARPFSLLFQGFGLVLGLGALLVSLSRPDLGVMGLLLALLAIFLPTWRARRAFDASVVLFEHTLRRELGS